MLKQKTHTTKTEDQQSRVKFDAALDKAKEILEEVKLPADAVTLYRAAEIIEESGWCRHQLRDWEGRHCARGAILAALGENPNDWDYHSNDCGELMRLEREHIYPTMRSICDLADWNNLDTTTKEDVVSLLQKSGDHARDRAS